MPDRPLGLWRYSQFVASGQIDKTLVCDIWYTGSCCVIFIIYVLFLVDDVHLMLVELNHIVCGRAYDEWGGASSCLKILCACAEQPDHGLYACGI